MIFLLNFHNEKLIILFNTIKHDKFFKPPTDGDSWSTYPNEHFFVKRFEGTSISGKELRYLERDIFSRRFSSDNPAYHHHIRDYHTLCRGGKLVRIFSFISIIYNFYVHVCFQSVSLVLSCTLHTWVNSKHFLTCKKGTIVRNSSFPGTIIHF